MATKPLRLEQISRAATQDEIALLEQSEILEAVGDYIDGLFGIFHLFPTSDDQLARAKEEGNDLRFVESIHQPGELLGFVLDMLKTETNCYRIQVEGTAEVSTTDDVLDNDLRIIFNLNLEFTELIEDNAQTLVESANTFYTSTDNLS